MIIAGTQFLGKKEAARRKFAKLMREQDVKASPRVFNSMIEQIKTLK